MPKPSDYMPKETIEVIWSNLEKSEELIKTLELAIRDAKAAGIDVLAREEDLKVMKDRYSKMRAVYGFGSE